VVLKLFAGPCVVESRDRTLRIAERLRGIVEGRPFDLTFKASYDKANRTSKDSFRSLGMGEALGILAEVRRETGLPINTDVHETAQVRAVAQVADTLQIPAFLCRQTDLLQAAGATGKGVLVKKGQFMAPEDMRFAVEKVRKGGASEVWLCERGTSFGYRNLVVDFRSLPILREFAPVVFDATHSVQRPAGEGTRSGGDRQWIPYLVRAAVAVGVDGLFLECHDDPDKALSDAATQMKLEDVPPLLDQVERIQAALD